MLPTLRSLSFFLIFFLSAFTHQAVVAQQLVHYWNFNNNSSLAALTAPTVSLVTGASIAHVTGGTSVIDFAGGTGQNFDVQNLNARNGDPAGSHLRFNNPIGGALVFSLPTTGFEQIVVRFATRRSTQGAGTQNWSYTTNGTDYTLFATINPVDGNPTLQTLNFTTVAGVNNNPNFKLRVEFAQTGGGMSGNNRFDNFTLDAMPIGGGDNIPPTVSFTPLNNTTDVPINTQPTITFNEPVRLIAGSAALTNANAASAVELRLNNSTGAIVPFTTTVSGNTITIVPSSNLQNSQTYYVALKGNTIEDLAGNAITTTQSITFTTISVQTQFNAGDLVIVAYRMNSTGTDDEIAVLTFVDILPGTQVRFTDNKYTTNNPPQCAGGFVWTAPTAQCVPAGTVFTIKPDNLQTSLGTVAGSGFGLSSSGDQVIIYTGTNTAPNYIFALSSNPFVATNTSCTGSNSMLPAGLVIGSTAVSLSTAPGAVSNNAVNAYYNGTQAGSPSALRVAILNPANWIAVGGGTPPQTWPNWSFPGPPVVQSVLPISTTQLRLVFNTKLNAASAQNLSNYTGINNLSSAQLLPGVVQDTVLLVYSTPFQATNNTITISQIVSASGVTMVCPVSFTFNYNTTISFASNFIVVNEAAGSANLTLNVANPSMCQVTLEVLGAPFSTADAGDFTLATQVLTFTTGTTHQIVIPIINDNDLEQHAEYFGLRLKNPAGCMISGDPTATIYIRDNDRVAPTPTQDITLTHVTSFDPSAGSSSCEVVAYDPVSKRLFTNSSVSNFLEIVDFSNPAALSTIATINMAPYGGITSVAVKNGIVAVAAPNANPQLDGSVVFFNTNGVFQKQVTVGALPDMITFTPDGTKVLTANEGEPNTNYTLDPEGSVSIIDISGGIAGLTQANVTTLYLTAFNSQEAALKAAGVRKLRAASTFSQDLEPEYITVSNNSQTAWVVCQENNALIEINLTNNTIADIWAFGTKDVSQFGHGYDVSDNNNQILIANWPIKSYYQPDGISYYSIGGVRYLITANEGDEREYAALNERTTVGAANYPLDPVKFPHADLLKKSYNLGRMRVTNLDGDTDNDGDYDEIYSVGSRSFSIFNLDTKSLVYDSGDAMELITAQHPVYASLFNASHDAQAAKNRSRAKGPEPESVTLATFAGRTFAFLSLERIGGVMVFEVTNPNNVTFVDYKNTRNLSSLGGDLGPETSTYISPADSPNGKAYLILANEISGTLTVFEIGGSIVADCDNTGAVTVNVNQTATPLCATDATAAAEATVTTGLSPFTYMWSNGNTTPQLTNVQAGTYTVTVTSKSGCTAVSTIQVTAPAPLTVTGIGQAPTCASGAVAGTSNGEVQLQINGGTTPYTVDAPTQNLTAGTYTFIVTDNNGCTQTTQVTVPEGAANTTYYFDQDNDGYGVNSPTLLSCTGAPAGFAPLSGDCNDANPAVNPGINEPCTSNVDLNCDGVFYNGAAAPPVLVGAAVSGNEATLTWSGGCAARYRVQLQRQGLSNWNYIIVTGGKTSAVAKNLTSGTYFWTVRAQTSVNSPYTTPVAPAQSFTIQP